MGVAARGGKWGWDAVSRLHPNSLELTCYLGGADLRKCMGRLPGNGSNAPGRLPRAPKGCWIRLRLACLTIPAELRIVFLVTCRVAQQGLVAQPYLRSMLAGSEEGEGSGSKDSQGKRMRLSHVYLFKLSCSLIVVTAVDSPACHSFLMAMSSFWGEWKRRRRFKLASRLGVEWVGTRNSWQGRIWIR